MSNYLLPHHQAKLQNSGLSPEAISARGYKTLSTKVEVERLSFSRSQATAPALQIPIWNAEGLRTVNQIRPDTPRINREGKSIKYELPLESKVAIDVPPSIREKVLDITQPLLVTEGPIKADAAASKGYAAVSVLGVSGWRADDPFWKIAPLKNRTCYIIFDSDISTNENVKRSALRLAENFRKHGAIPEIVILPHSAQKTKQGLDDYLASGKTDKDLLALDRMEISEIADSEPFNAMAKYKCTKNGLAMLSSNNKEPSWILLTNFIARITAEAEIDDGNSTRLEFEITCELGGETKLCKVQAEEYERMTWVMPHLGAGAIIFAGVMTRDHARAAIQAVSDKIVKRKVIEHLGWRKFGIEWVYFHAGGIIRSNPKSNAQSHDGKSDIENSNENPQNGIPCPNCPTISTVDPLQDVEVRVPKVLSSYRLPEKPKKESLIRDIAKLIELLEDTIPARLWMPLLSAAFRIAIDQVDFSIHLVGVTNSGKTTLTSLFCQFFGPDLHARNLALPFLGVASREMLLYLVDEAANLRNGRP
ncbi:DUF3854 domain-containing protein [Telmatocola sphagniphila]|uniref:DUF3854 domain-containing protein n=1 Tax=Telmatocola sphagniphila TaxID=1123043 RepID=A0A8E6B2M9_9BACT|nr:DUF3854 domain-containing protein [Telmatocola sphagniphila]QVL30284.1 DUF3854 domain-containing protein [Telmatocola sphagniphila]